jgi:acyl carrier protein
VSPVESIEVKLINLLGEKYGTRPTLDDSLALLCLDSVGMAELSFDIEQQFHVKVDHHFQDQETVQDLANYIRKLENSSHNQK